MLRKRWLLIVMLLLTATVLVVATSIRKSQRRHLRPSTVQANICLLPSSTPSASHLRSPAPSPTSTSTHTPVPSPSSNLVERLNQNGMLPCDPLALVKSLSRAGTDIPRVVRSTPVAFDVGDKRRFWIGDLDVSRVREITATLHLQTDHLQMWVDDQAKLEQGALEQSARVFEETIYPTNHRHFGNEWCPGVDGDRRVVVLNAPFSGAAGYFASANEYSRLVNPYSNECEIFVVNVGVLQPDTPGYNSVLAHEFQHLIHWYADSNEDAWVNEGASELAEDLNGFGPPMADIRQFQLMPNVQLNTWSDDVAELGAHYGSAYLMMRYLLNRFGPDSLHEMIQSPLNGIDGLQAVLVNQDLKEGFDDLFADWLVANALDDPELKDGRFGYPETEVSIQSQTRIACYPYTYTGQVHQYAAGYFELLPDQVGPLRIFFSGQPTTKLVPNEPASGRFQWWSNRGDSGHSFLERSFDLTNVATATLSFDLWYDIERGWDYAYVRASADGGESWKLLRDAHMTGYDPNGNALGPGYTGKSGSSPEDEAEAEPIWMREEMDLGAYCGGKVLLRLDYVTDEAVNRPGLCLDNLTLHPLGLVDDVETGEGYWHARGFVRHENVLQQRYIVQVVEFGREPRVRRLPVDADGQGAWIIEGFGREVTRALVIVSAIAPVTTQTASYHLEIERIAPTHGAPTRSVGVLSRTGD